MRHLISGMLLIMAVGLFQAETIYALNLHQHSKHQEVKSPFDAKPTLKSRHCELNRHSHIRFCPHSKFARLGDELRISEDCGGKPLSHSSGIPASGKPVSLLSSSIANPDLLESWTYSFSQKEYDSWLSGVPSPPPKYL
jgi:hypothetical protein